jgi:hypothetical protein
MTPPSATCTIKLVSLKKCHIIAAKKCTIFWKPKLSIKNSSCIEIQIAQLIKQLFHFAKSSLPEQVKFLRLCEYLRLGV